MNKISVQLIAFLIIISVFCSISFASFASGNVTYDADSEKFIFEPGSSNSPTDLFSEFKNMMPGDRAEQEITVKNDSSYGVKAKIYVRSLGAHDDSDEFLSKLHLTVAKSEDNTMDYMFNASSDQTDGMTDWVYLGTLYSGGVVNLVLTLDIPSDLDNSFQNTVGYIDWQFKVEAFPKDPDDPVPPQTGDKSNLYLYVILSILCLLIFVILYFKHKKAIDD